MRRNKYIVIITAIIICYFVSSFNITHPLDDKKQFQGPLREYGRELFHDYGCLDCHKVYLELEIGDSTLMGLSSRYSLAGLYARLNSSIIGHSSVVNHNLALIFNSSIDYMAMPYLNAPLLQSQADSLYDYFKSSGVSICRRSEVLALIGFLWMIPSVSEQIIADSMNQLSERKIKLYWDSLIENSESIIYSTIGDQLSEKKGEKLFQRHCYVCHGDLQTKGPGPKLHRNDSRQKLSVRDKASTIINGLPEKGMIPFRNVIPENNLKDLIAYLQFIDK